MARARSPGEVNCMRCGRGNPEHVRYCLDCGSELYASPHAQPDCRGARSESRPASSSTAALAAYGSGQASSRTTTGRPPAPDLHFGQRPPEAFALSNYEASLASATGAESAHADVDAELRCNACGVNNPRDGRFCCECGSPLRLGAPPPLMGTIVALSDAQSPPAPVTAPVPLAEPPAPPLDGTLASQRDPAPDRICPRCQGTNSPEARFCQLCGVSLVTPQERPPEAAPPISSGPVSKVMPDAWLVVIGQDGTPGRRYPLKRPKMDMGRASGDIVLDKDPYVCPLHARLTYGTRGFAIEDLGSVNGVYVRLGGGPVELRHGDLLLLGQAVLRFEIVEETERSISPAVRDSTRVFGTPAVPRRARLVVHTVEGCGRDIFYLSRPETILGREAGDIVFTDDPFMSRRHAALRRASATNTYTLRDLGSSNGTFIAIRGQQPLSPGDHVRIGQHLFRLDVQSGGPS